MPKQSLEIGVQVWLLDGDFGDRLRVYPAGFPVEPGMAYMFQHKNEHDFRSACGLGTRNVHFQWARTEERGTFAQCWVGVDELAKIGSKEFPRDERLALEISEVPKFDLTLITAQDREIPFPWAKVEQKKKLLADRKKSRKRKSRKKPR